MEYKPTTIVLQLIEELSKYAQPNVKKNQEKRSGSLNVIGVMMKDIRHVGKSLSMNHDLAKALFETNILECLMLGTLVASVSQLTYETAVDWVQRAQSTYIVDQGLNHLFMQYPLRHEWINDFLNSNDTHIRYGGYSLLATYFRSESLDTLLTPLGENALLVILDTIHLEPLTIQNAMNNAVVMAGLHVPELVNLATKVASHIGHVMPLVALNQCNIQSASDYLNRYKNQPKYSRVARLKTTD